jgi:hypothetical protein
MMNLLAKAAMGLLALTAQGCTQKPESYPLSSLSVNYQTWNCQQLANEADLLKDALVVAFEQRSAEHVAHLKAQREALQKARTLKRCSA